MEVDPAGVCATPGEETTEWPALERRSNGERRRSSRGWFELRARRDGIGTDRRGSAGNANRLSWAFWRRGQV